MESRSSSCSAAHGDGPDFLDFAVNQMSVDDDSECMFLLWPEKTESSYSFSKGYDKTRKELQRLGELKSKSNSGPPQQQREESEHNTKEENAAANMDIKLAIPGSNERRRKSHIDDELRIHSRQFSTTGDCSKSDKGSLQLINAEDKTPQTRRMEFEASKSAVEHWKAQTFRVSHGMKVGDLLDRGKDPLVRKENWSWLRNLPHEQGKLPRQANKKKLGLYDIATNLYALNKDSKKDPRMPSLKKKTNLSSAQRRGSLWLENSLRTNKTLLPPMESSELRRYSEVWIPETSVLPRYKADIWKKCSHLQRSAKQLANDLNGVAFKSVLHTLERTHLSCSSRNDVKKYSLPSILHHSSKLNQRSFRRKALPLVKSAHALAFKHHGDKLAQERMK